MNDFVTSDNGNGTGTYTGASKNNVDTQDKTKQSAETKLTPNTGGT
jgi:hypothetical protein